MNQFRIKTLPNSLSIIHSANQSVIVLRGVYFSFTLWGQKYDFLVGWGKNVMKMKKKRKYEGDEVEKWEIFTVPGGNIKFLKRGGGKNIPFWANMHP